MLNSSSNNPGIGNLNGAQSGNGLQNQASGEQNANSEPIIQEVYEDEPDDYKYVQQIRDVDEAEIRNLSAIQPPTHVDRRVYMASALFLIAALIGAGIGYGIASNAASKNDVQRKSQLARTIKNTVTTRIDGLKSLKTDFDALAGGSYNEASFLSFVQKVRSNTYPYMLDISSEVSAEAVLLIGDSRSNPFKELREYSAKSILLRQLLDTHGSETRAESEAISELQSKSDEGNVVFAMQVVPGALYYLATDAPRTQYANGAINVFTYRDVIEDDQQATESYSQIKTDNSWTEQQRNLRDYQSDNKKEMAALVEAGMDLPNHLIYEVVDKQGNTNKLFADEVLLVDRSLFFGESANAKQRYDWRTQNIKKLIEDLTAVNSHIAGELDAFIAD